MNHDGIIKFSLDHVEGEIDEEDLGGVGVLLLGWRQVLYQLGLIGQDPNRYAGFGYGNLSARIAGVVPSTSRFVITGTQTSALERLTARELCLVRDYDHARHYAQSRGQVRPSSEALTHAAVYDAWSEARFVFHVHSPSLWDAAARLGVAVTDPSVTYGTAQMAAEVQRLMHAAAPRHALLLAMGGHQDGLIAAATDADGAGAILVAALARVLGSFSP